MFCKNCGTKRNEGDVSCPNCGEQYNPVNKQSKSKLFKLLITIPVIVAVVIGTVILSFATRFLSKFIVNIDVTDEDIVEYLEEKYEGDFTVIELLDEKKSKSTVEYGCNTLYYNEYFRYYEVYSSEYDVNFIVVYDKSIGTLSGSKSSYESFYDNLYTVYYVTKVREGISTEYFPEAEVTIENQLGGSSQRYYSRVYYHVSLNISRDFTIEDYYTLVELSQDEELLSILDDWAHIYRYEIHINFNNVTFGISSSYSYVYGIYQYEDQPYYVHRENVESEKFIEYMNEYLLNDL